MEKVFEFTLRNRQHDADSPASSVLDKLSQELKESVSLIRSSTRSTGGSTRHLRRGVLDELRSRMLEDQKRDISELEAEILRLKDLLALPHNAGELHERDGTSAPNSSSFWVDLVEASEGILAKLQIVALRTLRRKCRGMDDVESRQRVSQEYCLGSAGSCDEDQSAAQRQSHQNPSTIPSTALAFKLNTRYSSTGEAASTTTTGPTVPLSLVTQCVSLLQILVKKICLRIATFNEEDQQEDHIAAEMAGGKDAEEEEEDSATPRFVSPAELFFFLSRLLGSYQDLCETCAMPMETLMATNASSVMSVIRDLEKKEETTTTVCRSIFFDCFGLMVDTTPERVDPKMRVVGPVRQWLLNINVSIDTTSLLSLVVNGDHDESVFSAADNTKYQLSDFGGDKVLFKFPDMISEALQTLVKPLAFHFQSKSGSSQTFSVHHPEHYMAFVVQWAERILFPFLKASTETEIQKEAECKGGEITLHLMLQAVRILNAQFSSLFVSSKAALAALQDDAVFMHQVNSILVFLQSWRTLAARDFSSAEETPSKSSSLHYQREDWSEGGSSVGTTLTPRDLIPIWPWLEEPGTLARWMSLERSYIADSSDRYIWRREAHTHLTNGGSILDLPSALDGEQRALKQQWRKRAVEELVTAGHRRTQFRPVQTKGPVTKSRRTTNTTQSIIGVANTCRHLGSLPSRLDSLLNLLSSSSTTSTPSIINRVLVQELLLPPFEQWLAEIRSHVDQILNHDLEAALRGEGQSSSSYRQDLDIKDQVLRVLEQLKVASNSGNKLVEQAERLLESLPIPKDEGISSSERGEGHYENSDDLSGGGESSPSSKSLFGRLTTVIDQFQLLSNKIVSTVSNQAADFLTGAVGEMQRQEDVDQSFSAAISTADDQSKSLPGVKSKDSVVVSYGSLDAANPSSSRGWGAAKSGSGNVDPEVADLQTAQSAAQRHSTAKSDTQRFGMDPLLSVDSLLFAMNCLWDSNDNHAIRGGGEEEREEDQQLSLSNSSDMCYLLSNIHTLLEEIVVERGYGSVQMNKRGLFSLALAAKRFEVKASVDGETKVEEVNTKHPVREASQQSLDESDDEDAK